MSFSKFYFGVDTSAVAPWPTCFPKTDLFYIGCIGGADGTWATDFEIATAQSPGIGFERTSSYWSLAGPSNAPEGPSNWGVTQANAFISARTKGKYASYVGGTTMFGDIESGNAGWISNNETDNLATLHGFLYTIEKYTATSFTPGLYISKSFWDEMMGSGATSSVPFVLWLAGVNPGDCTENCTDAGNKFNSTYTDVVLGGYRTMIWQYWPIGTKGCATSGNDLDITPYNGFLSGHWNPTT